METVYVKKKKWNQKLLGEGQLAKAERKRSAVRGG